MLDRQKLETVLVRRFPSATDEQIAAAANAIMGLSEEWEEFGDAADFGDRFDPACDQGPDGAEFWQPRRRIA
jgi:hypothetical protein